MPSKNSAVLCGPARLYEGNSIFKKNKGTIVKPGSLIFNYITGIFWAGSFSPVILIYKTDEFDDLYKEINNRINIFKRATID